MNLDKAIELLEYYQRWRLGADIEMPHPKQITEAIDVLLKEVKTLRKTS